MARFAVRHEGWCAAAVMALMAVNVFVGLGGSNVNDFDEARYGVTAYEMLQGRSFVVSTYAGQRETWALKPPLGYWLMALSYGVCGGSALAMRLPSALCALAAVAVTMAAARRWFNRRLALLAGAILATTFGYLSNHGARSGDFDSCLTLLLLLVAVTLPGVAASAWRVVTVALLLAFGFLLKSFAIVPMVLAACAWLLWTGAWRRLRVVPCLAAIAVFAAIVAAWAGARWHADGSPDFFLRMVREDVVGRSTSIVDRSTSSPLGYVTAIFDRFAPWPLLMLAAGVVALRGGRGARRSERPRPLPWPRRLWQARRPGIVPLLALWAGVPFAFISLVRTQHHWYLDPLYPALATIAAAAVLFLAERTPRRYRGLALAGLVALPLLLCEGRVLARVLIKEPMSADQRFLRALGKPRIASACRTIRTSCRLAHSERFLLEVAGGFEVVEPIPVAMTAAEASLRPPPGGATVDTAPKPAPPVPAAPTVPAAVDVAAAAPTEGAALTDGTCLLVGKQAWRRPPGPPADRLPARSLLLAESGAYALYRSAAAARSPVSVRR